MTSISVIYISPGIHNLCDEIEVKSGRKKLYLCVCVEKGRECGGSCVEVHVYYKCFESSTIL